MLLLASISVYHQKLTLPKEEIFLSMKYPCTWLSSSGHLSQQSPTYLSTATFSTGALEIPSTVRSYARTFSPKICCSFTTSKRRRRRANGRPSQVSLASKVLLLSCFWGSSFFMASPDPYEACALSLLTL